MWVDGRHQKLSVLLLQLCKGRKANLKTPIPSVTHNLMIKLRNQPTQHAFTPPTSHSESDRQLSNMCLHLTRLNSVTIYDFLLHLTQCFDQVGQDHPTFPIPSV